MTFSRAVSPFAAVFAIVVGGVSVAEWLLGLAGRTSLIPGLPPVAFNTAVALELCGVSLGLIATWPGKVWAIALARFSAAPVLLLGATIAAEFLAGADWRLNELLFGAGFAEPGHVPSRMALATALSFVCLGLALLLLGPRRLGLIHLPALAGLVAPAFEFLGYGYDLRGFAQLGGTLAPMALPTAISLALLSLGVLMARPEFPLRRLMEMGGTTGRISRHLLFFAISLPFGIGRLVLQGHEADVFSAGVALALFTVAVIVGYGTSIVWTAGTLRRAETIRQQAEAEMRAASQYARTLLEASLDPLVTINPEGKITDVNRATETVTGKPRGALIGTDFADYFTDPDKARASYREVLAKGRVTDYPLAIRRADGRITYVLYNASLYHDPAGAVAGVFAAARDVTARKRTEEELGRYHEHLEELVAARTGQVMAMNQRLEAINAELEAFAYSVSHDLRTPLRAVDGFAQILLEDYADKLDAEGRRLLGVVSDGAKRMGRLIDDILAFSRVGRQEMALGPVDMEQAVRSELKELEPTIGDRAVTFHIDALPPCKGDAAMLRRVWANLLQNAVKFTRPKPKALIEVAAKPGDGETVYWVKDNGVGFDMRFADKLFGVFQRLHGGEEFPGTGIGLAIVKRIISRHGGRVWAEGRVNEGATIFFALPTRESGHA